MLLRRSRLSIKAIPVLSADSGRAEQQVGRETEEPLQPACPGICPTPCLNAVPGAQGPIGKALYHWERTRNRVVKNEKQRSHAQVTLLGEKSKNHHQSGFSVRM